MVRQESRLLWLKEGDAPTRFFHSYANMRHRRKHIHSLEHNVQVLVGEEAKEEAIFSFYDEILGALDIPHLQLHSLCERFTEEEV
jgi:hypothetical protein